MNEFKLKKINVKRSNSRYIERKYYEELKNENEILQARVKYLEVLVNSFGFDEDGKLIRK